MAFARHPSTKPPPGADRKAHTSTDPGRRPQEGHDTRTPSSPVRRTRHGFHQGPTLQAEEGNHLGRPKNRFAGGSSNRRQSSAGTGNEKGAADGDQQATGSTGPPACPTRVPGQGPADPGGGPCRERRIRRAVIYRRRTATRQPNARPTSTGLANRRPQ
jgi:hypothetical protein